MPKFLSNIDNASKVSITDAANNFTSNNVEGALQEIGLELSNIPTEISYLDGVTSAIQTQLNGKQATITGGATTITSSNLTASRALVSDGSGKVGVATTTATELGYLNGVTSSIQTQLDNITPFENNAGAHNSVFRGKFLGTSVTTAQYNAISAGTFDDMFIGDYWTIGGVNYRIAHFNYYLRTGDTDLTTNHVVLVPDTSLYSARMNATNVTTGAYVGSEMYTTNLASAISTIESGFSGHVLEHRSYLHNAVTSGYTSAAAWYTRKVDLMTEANVYGTKHYGNATQGTNLANNAYVDKSQFQLFALNPQSINNRNNYWLRDVASAATFALVSNLGYSNSLNASSSRGVRPAFCIY